MSDVLLDSASWALILGVLSPLLISVVQQPRWTKGVRVAVSVIAAVVIGFVTVLANGGFDLSGGDAAQTTLSVIALVFVASATAYRSLWKQVGVTQSIEAHTSGVSVSDLDSYRGRHRSDNDSGDAAA